jgi:hypothetical protein
MTFALVCDPVPIRATFFSFSPVKARPAVSSNVSKRPHLMRGTHCPLELQRHKHRHPAVLQSASSAICNPSTKAYFMQPKLLAASHAAPTLIHLLRPNGNVVSRPPLRRTLVSRHPHGGPYCSLVHRILLSGRTVTQPVFERSML